ncbi:hypothetical protein FAES_0849 [Fibrella aestuarina BUZ 2]|uniref:DUF4230 domain-containing protein n=1 Tax=Fibrella aestuarina BUZ 2 TaxID=1166018 RepID=I0K407_9BACT|nr:DUF4230 domain-containing protein [Fibrella aestuarina]CCG98860.1 hypothetical protein FAES_0849 [Fibrella aestuarina BUZ 2]
MDFLNTLLLLTVGGAGGVGLSLWLRRKPANTVTDVRHESTLLLERIEKVFKVVMAEGYFSEIYNYQDQRTILYVFNDPKKAMIIAKSKVLVGFDFQKVRFRQVQTGEKTLIVEAFPGPEILSIDTDYKFYDIQAGIFNHFSSEAYTSILEEAKQVMHERAMQSDLPRIANNQIQYMMFQLAASMGWTLQLPEADQRRIELLDEGKALPPGETTESA